MRTNFEEAMEKYEAKEKLTPFQKTFLRLQKQQREKIKGKGKDKKGKPTLPKALLQKPKENVTYTGDISMKFGKNKKRYNFTIENVKPVTPERFNGYSVLTAIITIRDGGKKAEYLIGVDRDKFDAGTKLMMKPLTKQPPEFTYTPPKSYTKKPVPIFGKAKDQILDAFKKASKKAGWYGVATL